ncbi:MAG TPA: hypothetical protein VND19_02160 [Acetobacteraceae bacterium]|nr:hypothetical protein [Acetobacteraceae bacterium]
MPQVKVERVREGQHPSEVVVSVRTADGGTEKLVVDARSIRNGAIEVGYPVGDDGDRLLVELPRESVRGLWRIWVARGSMIEEVPA